MKGSNAHLTRWSLALQLYGFTVEYKCGRANTNADALSRMPIPPESTPMVLEPRRGEECEGPP